MAIYTLQPGQPQQIVYAASGQRNPPITEYTIANLDQQDTIYLGSADAAEQQPDLSADLCRDQLSALQSVTVRATLDWWALNPTTDVIQVDVIPEGISESTSPLDAAEAFISANVPIAIAEEIASAGIPLPAPQLLYNIGPSGPSIAGQWGASVFGPTTWPGPFTSFETVTGTTITTFKIYGGHAQGGLPMNLSASAIAANVYIQYCIANPGVRACLCMQPLYDGTDPAQLAIGLANLKAAGLNNAVIILDQEVQDHGVTPAQFISMMQSCYSVVQAHYPGGCVYNSAGSAGVTQWQAFNPGSAFWDIIAIDLYATAYYANPANDPSGLIAIAHAAGKPWAIFEFAASVSHQTPPPITGPNSTTQYIQRLTSLVTADLDAGLPVDSCMWYYAPGGNPNNDPTPFVAPLQALAAALTSGGTAPFSIAAGATAVLTPLNPSPVAGYATAQTESYDILVNLVAGAASTSPWIKARLIWLNNDDPSARPVDVQQWLIPMGTNGTAGTQIWGRGPMRGQFLKVELISTDTVACVAQVEVNATSRTVTRDDWKWDVDASVAVPGYTRPVDGGVYGNVLGGVVSRSCPANGSVSWLFSLFAGKAYARFGTAAASAVISVTVVPQPTSIFNGLALLDELLSGTGASGPGDFTTTLILPRGPCLVTFTNSDSSAHNVTGIIVSQD